MKRRHEQHMSHFEKFLDRAPDLWRDQLLPRLGENDQRSLLRTSKKVRSAILRHNSDVTRRWYRHVEPNRGVWTFRSPLCAGPHDVFNDGQDFAVATKTNELARPMPAATRMSQFEFENTLPRKKFRRLEVTLSDWVRHDFLEQVHAEDLLLLGGHNRTLPGCPPHVDRVAHTRYVGKAELTTFQVRGDDRVYIKINRFADLDGVTDAAKEGIGGLLISNCGDATGDLTQFPNLQELYVCNMTNTDCLVLPETVTHLRTWGGNPFVEGPNVRFLDMEGCGQFNLPNLEVVTRNSSADPTCQLIQSNNAYEVVEFATYLL